MLYRKQTRTVLGGVETTRETASIAATTVAFELTTSDYFYVGFHRKFNTRYFNLSTVNTNTSTVSVQYWNGEAWADVEDLIDETVGFTLSGFISWQNQTNWQKYTISPVDDVELYWVRISVSANLSTGTALQSVQNLFCDATLLRALYPELVYDTRYLPPGRNDFLEQLEAGKNLVVLRLKQKRAIDDESEVLDVSEVAVAAAHATAFIILNPIAKSDEEKAKRDKAQEEFENELNEAINSFDTDDDGIIDEQEKNVPAGNFWARC